MNKKQRVKAAIQKQPVDRVPSSFSIHFPKEIAQGEKAVQAHLDFYRQTDVDILKIMNENLVPPCDDIFEANDWRNLPTYHLQSPFMVKQLDIIKRILEETNREDVYALATIHGICASMIHPIEARCGYVPVREMHCAHYRENPGVFLDACKRTADVMCELVQTCIRMGCDGIYYAGLGAEKHFFTDDEFVQAVEVFDRQILTAAREVKSDIFLHICKENLEMQRYANYQSLCDVVNWGVYETNFTLQQGKALFPNATIMGGLKNRSGALVQGDLETLKAEVKQIIADFGTTGFMLGADCTLPTEIPYERIRAAVEGTKN